MNLSLYLVTDRGLSQGRTIEDLISAAVKGGVTIVQVREKECSTRAFIDLAKKIQQVTQPAGVPLIINDRIDVAQAVGAEGVHIGQQDMPYRDARQIFGADKIIGLSVESIEDARAAQQLDVDYLGVSPVFFTTTKKDIKSDLGLKGLRTIRSFSRHPLVGIGGINQTNAADVIENGADGIAVVSAICSAPDPQKAARTLSDIIHRAMKMRNRRTPGPASR